MGRIYIIVFLLFFTAFAPAVSYERHVCIDAVYEKTDSLSNESRSLREIYVELEHRKKALLEQKDILLKIEQLQGEIQEEEERFEALNIELAEISRKEDAIKSEKDSLDRIEDGIVTKIIQENERYLDGPFSQMSFEDLSQIREKCRKYSYNSKIKEFLDKVGNKENNKRVYDRIMTILNSPYDKLKIGEALSGAEGMKGMSDVQQKEVDEGKELLRCFHDGLKAFGEFIENLNNRREKYSNYIWLDFLDDRRYIINNDLQERIDSCLLPVPYLYGRYNAFMAEFQNAPAEHSAIEKEILDLCETIGDN